MKKILCVFMVFALFLISSCYGMDETADQEYIIYYNNNIYDKMKYWSPINTKIISKEKAWAGFTDDFNENLSEIKNNHKIGLYEDDPEAIFISNEGFYVEFNVYHKRADVLPDYLSSQQVEKIVLQGIKNHDDIIFTGSEMEEFQKFIKQCNTDLNDLTVKEQKKPSPSLSEIVIYFNDYPAYYYLGSIEYTASGELAYTSIDIPDFEHNTYCVVLPESLSKYIQNQLQN